MERGSGQLSSIKNLLFVENNSITASQLGDVLAEMPGYQDIVASDYVTALRIPALVQT